MGGQVGVEAADLICRGISTVATTRCRSASRWSCPTEIATDILGADSPNSSRLKIPARRSRVSTASRVDAASAAVDAGRSAISRASSMRATAPISVPQNSKCSPARNVPPQASGVRCRGGEDPPTGEIQQQTLTYIDKHPELVYSDLRVRSLHEHHG